VAGIVLALVLLQATCILAVQMPLGVVEGPLDVSSCSLHELGTVKGGEHTQNRATRIQTYAEGLLEEVAGIRALYVTMLTVNFLSGTGDKVVEGQNT
jgi:hypothetical protein